MANVDLNSKESIENKIKRLEDMKSRGHSASVINKQIKQLKLFLKDLEN